MTKAVATINPISLRRYQDLCICNDITALLSKMNVQIMTIIFSFLFNIRICRIGISGANACGATPRVSTFPHIRGNDKAGFQRYVPGQVGLVVALYSGHQGPLVYQPARVVVTDRCLHIQRQLEHVLSICSSTSSTAAFPTYYCSNNDKNQPSSCLSIKPIIISIPKVVIDMINTMLTLDMNLS